MPHSKGITPVWDTAEFPSEQANNALTLLVSGDGKAPLQINQDARIYASRLSNGTALTHKIKGQAYVLADPKLPDYTRYDQLLFADLTDIITAEYSRHIALQCQRLLQRGFGD